MGVLYFLSNFAMRFLKRYNEPFSFGYYRTSQKKLLIMIPEGNTTEDIREREQIIREFYRDWKEKNPSQRKYNLSLKEYINIRMVSIVETSEHAAKTFLSTLAVLQLDAILTGAKVVSIRKPKEGNKNQKPFERILIMKYSLTGIGTVKMTVGVRRRTHEKVQYCITAINNQE